ncbi:MAG: response regulator transcription factor [Prolixibacteraceae bacterium]|nr:response regulator transcription factor [Prolixibacteraceae bacterium]
MSIISYLIVEDEIKSRQTLLKKIDMCHLDNLKCMGLAADAEEALWFVEKNYPDIILVDINLPGKNGFEFLDNIKRENYDPEVIFTSAYTESEYLLKALKKGAVNYLIKPIDIDELTSSFEKAISRVLLKRNQVSSSGKIKLIGIKEVLYLKPEQVAYCRADGHYTNMFLTNGKLELICQSIGSIEKDLPSKMFFRIDRSSLVNINIVESIDLKKQTCMLGENGFNLSIEISVIGLKRLMNRLEQK